MKISAKSRYALAALIKIGQSRGFEHPTTVLHLSEKLGISKIYLEQVFSLLKRGDIVYSIKGAGGGYQLSRPMRDITAFDILNAIETSLFEKSDQTVGETAPTIESVIQSDVFEVLDDAVATALKNITLETLVAKVAQNEDDGFMYYV